MWLSVWQVRKTCAQSQVAHSHSYHIRIYSSNESQLWHKNWEVWIPLALTTEMPLQNKPILSTSLFLPLNCQTLHLYFSSLMGKKIVGNWMLLGKEATSAVLFIPLIILYLSATGAIVFPFCKEFSKSFRSNSDPPPVPEWERQGGEQWHRHRGSGAQSFTGGSGLHLEVTLWSSWAGEAEYSHRRRKGLNSFSINCLGCTSQLTMSHEVFQWE